MNFAVNLSFITNKLIIINKMEGIANGGWLKIANERGIFDIIDDVYLFAKGSSLEVAVGNSDIFTYNP
jgi:hypothetical protein